MQNLMARFDCIYESFGVYSIRKYQNKDESVQIVILSPVFSLQICNRNEYVNFQIISEVVDFSPLAILCKRDS
jgi:hypothetical protein